MELTNAEVDTRVSGTPAHLEVEGAAPVMQSIVPIVVIAANVDGLYAAPPQDADGVIDGPYNSALSCKCSGI